MKAISLISPTLFENRSSKMPIIHSQANVLLDLQPSSLHPTVEHLEADVELMHEQGQLTRILNLWHFSRA